MKRRIIAALMALCLCIGLLPATALAVEGEATDYISLSDDSSGSSNVGEKPGTVTVVVIDATNNQELGKTTFTRNCTANSLTISLVDGIKDEYDIESVDTNGSYSDNLSADSYSIESWSSPYGEGGLFTVYLCPEFEAPYLPDGEIENLNLTRTYRIYPTQVLKMLRALNADISPDTQIVDIKPIWVKSFAEDDKSFSDVNVESDYGSLIVTSSDGNVDTVQPTNLRKLEITYNNGGDNKTVEVYSKDLRCTIEGTISQYYNIEWNDDSFHIVYFYNETDGNAGNHYFPYAIRFVDDGETLGDQMPPDPVYDNSLYEFVNWEEGGFDGSGNIFNENTPVNDDLTVFARKISTEHAGTIIQVSNENNQLFDRVAELYNVSSDTKLSGNDIIKDSVKIRVNGIGEEHTNETYFSNRWLDITKPGWYEVANNSAPGQDGLPTTNEHVPFDNIREIVVYFEANGIEGQQSVTIPVGSDAGSISKLLTATEVTVELDVNSKPNRPTESDLENPKGILGENAVTVDCTSETADHADKTYGLKDGYTIGDVEWRGTGDAAAYYVDITNIAPDAYVTAYNTTIENGHALSPADQGAETITLKWVDSSWTVASDVPVIFTVTCDDEVGDGYTLTYNYNQGGGDSTTEKVNQTYAANEKANLPDQIDEQIDTKEDGVVFVGWTEKPNNYTKSTPATEKPNGMVSSVTFSNANITVHAVWAQDADNDDIPDYEDEDFAMQNVYVYAKPIGSGTDGALTEAEEEILKETYGLTLNAKGYCVLGKLGNVLLPYASDQTWQTNCHTQYESVIDAAFAAGKFVGYEQGKSYDSLLKALEWYNLSVSSGADGYPEAENYPSWHLDGNLNISAKYKLTYDANGGTIGGNPTFLVNGIALADATNYKLGEETGYKAPTHADEGTEDVLFAGWTTDVDAKGKIYSVEDATAPNANIPAAVDAVDLTKNDTVYALWSYDEDNDGTPDINEIIVTPADITIYTGGDSYTGEIVDSNGVPVTSGEDETQDYNGFPEPGFYITLPTALNDQLREDQEDSSLPVDLSNVLSFVYEQEQEDTEKHWTLQMYNPASGANNIAYKKFIYQLEPGAEQAPVRLLIKDAAGKEQPSDRFEFDVETLYQEYTMTIYGGENVETNEVQAVIEGDTYSVFVDTGDLTVRGVKGEDSTSAVVTEKPEELDKITAVAADDVTYYINESAIPVRDDAEIHLLADELAATPEALVKAAKDAIKAELENPEYDFMYLDLVDSSNGNAYVTMQGTDTVTIHWPIPGDAKEGSAFYVVHFDGLDREYDVDELDDLLKNGEEVQVIAYMKDGEKELTVGEDSVSFTTSTFSPFALVYETTSTPTTPQYTVEFKPGDHGSLLGTTIFHVNAGNKVISVPTVNEDSNYDFTGWLGSDGNTYTSSKILGLSITKDMTFTAQYRYTGDSGYDPKEATLRFNSRGGTEFEDEVRDNPFRYNPYNKIPSRPGYRFTGWYDSSRLDNRYDEDEEISVPMGITTVWAGWEETSVPSMLNGDDHYAYIQGYSDGTVRPNANITRAQVATIFFRLLDEDVRDDSLTTYNTFPDVDEDYWANTAISTMASLGVINGRNSGLFDPDAYITRAEFAAICARFDDSGVDGITTFTDTVGHWAEDEISRAAALGWIQGYSDGTFRPNQYITRAQAVTMINRVLCRLPEDTDDLLSGMNTWTDCHEDDWFYLAIQEATNSHDFVAKDRVYESWTDLNRAPDWSRYE